MKLGNSNSNSNSTQVAQNLRIAFGHRNAAVNRNINSLYDLITGVTPTLRAYESIGQSRDFFHRSAFVEMKDLTLAATACSSISYEVTEDSNFYFFLPLSGESFAQTAHKNYISSPSHGAFIATGQERKGFTSEMSMLQATLDLERLKSTALTMAGPSLQKLIEDRLRSPHVLPMQAGNLRFDHLFSTICQTIDDCGLQSATLNALGVDDLFYRAVITMTFPELFLDLSALQEIDKKYVSSRKLELVCDYVVANLEKTLDLTSLEEISGMSARALQYAFRERFNVTPTQWIREQRLDRARTMLQWSHNEDSIVAVAMSLGFSNHSIFSQYYKARFGELPSETKRKFS